MINNFAELRNGFENEEKDGVVLHGYECFTVEGPSLVIDERSGKRSQILEGETLVLNANEDECVDVRVVFLGTRPSGQQPAIWTKTHYSSCYPKKRQADA